MLENISVSGNALIAALAGFFIFIVALIVVVKLYVKRQSSSNLTEKYSDHQWKSPLTGRAKYPDVDVFKMSWPLFLLGAVLALAITWLSFNYTQEEVNIHVPDNALDIPDDIEIEPPRTSEPPPPPPPPRSEEHTSAIQSHGHHVY